MPAPSADRNLLFGILALQLDFVSKDALIAAMHAWVLAKDRPLGDILADQGALTPEHRALLEALVVAHLARHDNDAAKSLAAVSSLGDLRHDLERVADADVQASLSAAATAHHGGPATANEPPASRLRYRVLRLYAEGGLGKVSVAHDEELHCEVALKEIKDQHADRPDSRARFVLEATVTGGLEHPGIVPVYGLGTYGDGRPFYAMRFVKGDSLKEAIDHFHAQRQPVPRLGFEGVAFRGLLGRFVDVCNAVAYAHSRRVLHRDLKPGNILLGKYGETLLVDWGLAKPLGAAEPSRADEPPLQPVLSSGSGQPLPGAVVGTPAYMAPEQAAGRWDVVGGASDVYGLGAVLYTLLTGRAPVTETLLPDVLRKVERGDIPPPRKVQPVVPPTLEAVCRKAMALRPEDRYASALALAADIEHWLADEPVSAYREPLSARARRWMRRHRLLVTGAATVSGMAMVLLAVTAAQSERARRAVAAECDRAVDARNQTRESLDAMISEDALGWLERQKELLPPQREFLERVLGYYRQFAAEPGEDDLGRARLARANVRVGVLQHRLGRPDAAAAAYRRAIDLSERLTADRPTDPEYRRTLGTSQNHLGILLMEQGKAAEAEAAYRAALAVRAKLAADFPAVPDYRSDLAASQNNLGVLLARAEKWPAAETVYRTALALRQKLAAGHPRVAEYRSDLAATHNNLGHLLEGLGRRPEAETAYRAALAEYGGLTAESPADPDYRAVLAATHTNLGNLLAGMEKWPEAEAAYRSALAGYERLAADHPGVPE
jgi:serine/threonine-protein kinase